MNKKLSIYVTANDMRQVKLGMVNITTDISQLKDDFADLRFTFKKLQDYAPTSGGSNAFQAEEFSKFTLQIAKIDSSLSQVKKVIDGMKMQHTKDQNTIKQQRLDIGTIESRLDQVGLEKIPARIERTQQIMEDR